MPLLNLKGAQSSGQRALFGAASVLDFGAYTLAANQTTPVAAAQIPLPCNVKILALALTAIGASGNGLAANLSSGPSFGTFATGTVTFTGTAGATGTVTLSIASAGGGPTQTVVAVITSGFTATQSAAALVAAINAATTGNQVYATNLAGVVTLYSVSAQIQGAQTYAATLQTVTTQTVSPTSATALTAGTAARGTPDNTNLGVVPPVTAASGQFWLNRFVNVPISSGGTNTVIYPGTPAATGTDFGADWDIIFPCTRTLTLALFAAGFGASTVVQASALVVPIILNPTQSGSSNTVWAPGVNTIGAPSTD